MWLDLRLIVEPEGLELSCRVLSKYGVFNDWRFYAHRIGDLRPNILFERPNLHQIK